MIRKKESVNKQNSWNKTIVINNKKTNKRTKVISKKETTQKPEADPYQIRHFQIHRTPHMNRTTHYYSSNNVSLSKKRNKKEKGMYRLSESTNQKKTKNQKY